MVTIEPGDDVALATRAAWLYFVASLTQGEIAHRLEVTPAKAHRLIARAQRDGLVRVFVEGPAAGCPALESDLTRLYGLGTCRVTPDLGEEDVPLLALGHAGASYLRSQFESGRHRVIGVGHGRTLAAAVEALPRLAFPDLTFVSLLGGLPRQTRANPFDVIHRLSERTGAEALIVPVPFFARSAADRPVLLAQGGVAEALGRAAEASLHVLGVGQVADAAFLASSGAVSHGEIEALKASGAAGEMLGRYFDTDGRQVSSALHDRVIALDPETVRGRELAVIAGGPGKEGAIAAILATGLASTLITDERTARRLVAIANDRAQKRIQGREPCTRREGTSQTV